jgi:hypothetical protein
MPTNRTGGNRRRQSKLPEHTVVDLLCHGTDFFNELPAAGVDDPETRAMLKAEWARPHIREAVLAQHARLDGRYGPYSWAEIEFDGAVEDPESVAAREAAERARWEHHVYGPLAQQELSSGQGPVDCVAVSESCGVAGQPRKQTEEEP